MLSEKIRELRRKEGLSQEELAERVEVSRQAVSKWELGSAVPTVDKLVELADFFGVSLDWLMRGENFSQNTGSKPEERPNESNEQPMRRNDSRRTAGKCLIGTAAFAFALIAVLWIMGRLDRVSGSFAINLNGVEAIVVCAVLCAAIGSALLISLKK